MARRLGALLLFLLPLLLLAGLPPAPVQAQTTPACQGAAQAALSRVGGTYSQGGHHPADPPGSSRVGPTSFDCSGLVWWAYDQVGVDVGWTTTQQINDGQRLPCTLADLDGANTTCWAPGDLVFLQYSGGQHVSIYAGNGLFVDAYNHATGVVLHDVAQDSFYQAHFWQARRVVSGCEGLTIDPGTPGVPTGAIPWEYPQFDLLPDLVSGVSFTIPQCDDCTEDGTPVLERLSKTERKQRSAELSPGLEDWVDEFTLDLRWLPGGREFTLPYLNPVNGVLKIFEWLRFWLWQYLLDLICWLLTIAAWLVNIFTDFTNLLIGLFNLAWTFALFAWLTARVWLFILWDWLNMALQFFGFAQAALVWLHVWLLALWDLLLVLLSLLGQLVVLWWQVIWMLIQLLGWLVALSLGVIVELLAALQGETLPTELQGNGHGVYYITRGILDAIHDSPLGWLMLLMYGLAYLGFFFWLAKFMTRAGGGN